MGEEGADGTSGVLSQTSANVGRSIGRLFFWRTNGILLIQALRINA